MKRFLLFAAFTLLITACIENDIPYPTIYGNFTSFQVVGQMGSSTINTTKRTVVLQVAETVNRQQVVVANFSTTEQTTASIAIGDTINLIDSAQCTLTTYQDYVWTIYAKQEIIRRTLVSGQIGAAVFDVENCTATIYVNNEQDVSNITVTEIKLGPANAITTPDPTTVTDFTNPQQFNVSVWGQTETWQVVVIPTNEQIKTLTPEVWAKFAVLNGEYDISSPNAPTFEYCEQGSTTWIPVSSESISINGAQFTDTIRNLTPETNYQYRAVLGEAVGNTMLFTTEDAPTLPNMNFGSWHYDDDIWNPWPINGEQIWQTGNSGVASFASCNTTPTDGSFAIADTAAKLETIAVSLVGLAAGNIFVGDFQLNIFNPVSSVKFGKPYTGRPTKLKGYYKYSPQVINKPTDSEHYGEMDKCHIYIYLEDWEGATTRPENPIQIAHGELKSDVEVANYTQFEIDINYSIKNRKPSHIIIVATSSYLGDYYTGGIGSTLYVDEFEFSFD